MLLLLSSASATPMAVCSDGVLPVGSAPASGATDVPVDARIAVVFSEQCSGSAFTWTATLRDEATLTEVPTTLGSDTIATSLLLELFPVEPLAPDTAYLLSVLATDTSESVELGFTTGRGEVTSLTGEPTLVTGDVLWLRSLKAPITTLQVEIEAEPAADPQGLSVVQVRIPEEPTQLRTFEATEPIVEALRWTDIERPAEVCPQVRQIDGLGVATEWSEGECVPVPGLCSTGGRLSGLEVIGMVAVLWRSRRRRAPGPREGHRAAPAP